MTREENLRALVEWLRDDDGVLPGPMRLSRWADAVEALLNDDSTRLQAHRANATVIIAALITSNQLEGTTPGPGAMAQRIENFAHVLLAAEQPA